MDINGAPCLRERKYTIPTIPKGMMAKLKLLWFRGVWQSTEDDHSPAINKEFLDHMTKIEDYVEANYKPVTTEIPLPEYDWKNGSPEDFYEKFVKTPQPVVLRGYALQTEAVKKWSFDSLIEKCGHVNVNLSGPDSDWVGPLHEVRDPKIYCANADAPFVAFPELAEDLSIPKLQPYIKKRNTWNQFFIGQKATGSGYHCAGIWNFFFMIEGQKKWWFIDPEMSWMMYPNNNTGALAYASLVSFPWKADTSVYRLFQYAPHFTCTLNPGDVLLNPPWWWHAIDNITPTSVAVATRWDALMGGDDSFYEINRTLSMQAMLNPLFPKFLFTALMNAKTKAGSIMRAGAGAFEEDDMTGPKNQKARNMNNYHGRIQRKIKMKKKW